MAGDIIKGEEYFFTSIYEGNGGGQRVGNFVPFTDNGTIAKSCMFESGDTADKLQATIGTSSTANARRKMTISMWYKWTGTGGNYQTLWTVGGDGQTPYIACYINNNGSRPKGGLTFFDYTGSGSSYNSFLDTKAGFRDTSKWYHVVFSMDTTQSTDSDRFKIYVDGNLQATDTNNYYSQDFDTGFGTNVAYAYGTNRTVSSGSYWFDGYLAEINHVDGTAYGPETFGITDTSTGRWIPKSLGSITYGDNGHRLHFANSAGQTIGDDLSGNGNDFTVSDLAATNITTDSPTQNFPTIDPNKSALTLSEGNTVGVASATGIKFAFSSMTFDPSDSTGYYMEFKFLTAQYGVAGFRLDDSTVSISQDYRQDGYVAYNSVDDWSVDDLVSYAGGNVSPTYLANDSIIGVYIKENNLYYSFNGAMQNSSNPVAVFSRPGRYRITIGHNANYSPYAKVQIILPQSKWNYTPSGAFSDFREIQQDNLPETGKGIPDFVWIKNRDQGDAHTIYDSTRGPTKEIGVEEVDETTDDDGLTKFLKGGFAIGEDVKVNSTGESYAAWNWIANGGTTAANTDGSGASIASVTQVNQTAGFSIITHTGTGSAGTIAHGLSQAPEMVWTKIKAASVSGFTVGCSADPTGSGGFYQFLYLNENTNSRASSVTWNDTAPTNKVFSVGTSSTTNRSNDDYLTFCWHSVEGFSKIGGYTGNGSTDGTFVYTGFKPAWLITKKTSGSGNWCIMDSTRSPINPLGVFFSADSAIAEVTTSTRQTDFLSNGFKFRGANDATNLSGQSYIFMAFAEHPFNGDGTSLATAR